MFLFCCSGVMSERYQKRKTALLMIHRCFTLMDSIITLWSTLYKMLRFFYQLPTNSWTFSQLSKLLIGSVDEYCLDDVCFLPTVLETAKRKKTNNENHDSLWTENHCTMKGKRLPFLAYFRWWSHFGSQSQMKFPSFQIGSDSLYFDREEHANFCLFSLNQNLVFDCVQISYKADVVLLLLLLGGGGVTNLLVPVLWYYLVDIENMF